MMLMIIESKTKKAADQAAAVDERCVNVLGSGKVKSFLDDKEL